MQKQAIRQGFGLVGLCALALFMGLSEKAQAMDAINVDIGGTAGTTYSAHWTVENAGQTQEYHQEHGQVPAKFSYRGNAIAGTVTLLSEGQLTLTVEKSGNRSRSATQGKGSTLQFSVR
ncbi:MULTISPECIES: hypothetical protein [Oceanisphaera]|uniref:Uncharacterized protein n=1 Tax=Oceanisphaera ostreae TaxID=914151 RepID=A0ABW3KLA9_9GAMM